MVSEQAVDGPSPLDTMIQRLQQEQDQRLGTNDTPAAPNSRSSRGEAVARTAVVTAASPGGSRTLGFSQGSPEATLRSSVLMELKILKLWRYNCSCWLQALMLVKQACRFYSIFSPCDK